MSAKHTLPAPPEQDGVLFWHVPGFPGYCAGTDGSVWGCRDFRGGVGSRWRRLRPFSDKKGYLYVVLMKEGRKHRLLLHRLILEVFVGPCPEGTEACHFPDQNRANCRLKNLRWDTRSANHEDKRTHGTLIQGEQCHSHKLSEDDVRTIRRLGAQGVRHLLIAQRFGVRVSNVNLILARKTWKHVL